MNRRGFLSTLLKGTIGTAAVVVAGGELWTPGKVTHFLPPAAGWKPIVMSKKMQDLIVESVKGLFSKESMAMADHLMRQPLPLQSQFDHVQIVWPDHVQQMFDRVEQQRAHLNDLFRECLPTEPARQQLWRMHDELNKIKSDIYMTSLPSYLITRQQVSVDEARRMVNLA